MREIYPSVYEVLPSKPTPKKYRSFFVKQEAGNLLIPCFSNSSSIEAHFEDITALGGLSQQLLGDSHFKSEHCDAVAERFGAALYCSEVEAPDVSRTVQRLITFPFERHLLTPSVEVIPTPGHRPGGVCYLITSDGTRYLFVGDFIWHDGEGWIVTATKGNGRPYVNSLHLLNALDFDVLLANCTISNPAYAVALEGAARQAFFAALVAQMEGR